MGLDTFIDKIRINKFSEFLAAEGIYYLAIEIAEVFARQDFNYGNGVNMLIGALNLGLSVLFTKKQNQRYEGIVEGIDRHGYDERFCSMYMNHPCGRSVVKTTLKRTGNFDKYKELKTKYPLTKPY